MQALKGLVIGMGMLIVVGLGMVVYGIYQKASNPNFKFFKNDEPAIVATAPAMTAPLAPTQTFGETLISVPLGAQIEQMTPSGNRLLLRLRADKGAQSVIVIDLNSGQRLGKISLIPRP